MPYVVMGRSIGATCAVHLASTKMQVHGLILDSGLMSIPDLPLVRRYVQDFLGQGLSTGRAPFKLVTLPGPGQAQRDMRFLRTPRKFRRLARVCFTQLARLLKRFLIAWGEFRTRYLSYDNCGGYRAERSSCRVLIGFSAGLMSLPDPTGTKDKLHNVQCPTLVREHSFVVSVTSSKLYGIRELVWFDLVRRYFLRGGRW